MSSYREVLILLTALQLIPAAWLTWLLRPKPLRFVMRGGEASVCFAVALGAVGRIVAIIGGEIDIKSPTSIWADISIIIMGLVALLLWARLAQKYRHWARNHQHQQLLISQATEMGIDVDELLRQKGLKPPKHVG